MQKSKVFFILINFFFKLFWFFSKLFSFCSWSRKYVFETLFENYESLEHLRVVKLVYLKLKFISKKKFQYKIQLSKSKKLAGWRCVARTSPFTIPIVPECHKMPLFDFFLHSKLFFSTVIIFISSTNISFTRILVANDFAIAFFAFARASKKRKGNFAKTCIIDWFYALNKDFDWFSNLFFPKTTEQRFFFQGLNRQI